MKISEIPILDNLRQLALKFTAVTNLKHVGIQARGNDRRSFAAYQLIRDPETNIDDETRTHLIDEIDISKDLADLVVKFKAVPDISHIAISVQYLNGDTAELGRTTIH